MVVTVYKKKRLTLRGGGGRIDVSLQTNQIYRKGDPATARRLPNNEFQEILGDCVPPSPFKTSEKTARIDGVLQQAEFRRNSNHSWECVLGMTLNSSVVSWVRR